MTIFAEPIRATSGPARQAVRHGATAIAQAAPDPRTAIEILASWSDIWREADQLAASEA